MGALKADLSTIPNLMDAQGLIVSKKIPNQTPSFSRACGVRIQIFYCQLLRWGGGDFPLWLSFFLQWSSLWKGEKMRKGCVTAAPFGFFLPWMLVLISKAKARDTFTFTYHLFAQSHFFSFFLFIGLQRSPQIVTDVCIRSCVRSLTVHGRL